MTYDLRHLKEKVELAPFLVGAQKFALKTLCSKALQQSQPMHNRCSKHARTMLEVRVWMLEVGL